MNKTLPVVLAAATLALCTAPAHANATVEEGRVGIHVQGHGLRVDSVGGYMDGHGTGVRAQLYAFAAGSTPYDVTGWKNATRHSWGLTKISIVNWNWKGGRIFRTAHACAASSTRPPATTLAPSSTDSTTPEPAVQDAAVAVQRVAARCEAACTETLLVAVSQ